MGRLMFDHDRAALNRNRVSATWSVVAIIIVYLTAVYCLRPQTDPCNVVCDSCDMAVWHALAMHLETPALFARDRIFSLQLPVFPTAMAHGLNFLGHFTSDIQSTERLGELILAVVFLIGLALLSRAVIADDVTSALIIVLTVLSSRYELTHSLYWGLPVLKPSGVVMSLGPWFLWLLHGAVRGKHSVAFFAAATAAAVYVHPPAGLMWLGCGLFAYFLLDPLNKHRWRSISVALVVIVVILMPFVIKQFGSSMDGGPPMSVVQQRASYAIFPSYSTALWLASYLLFPGILCLWLLPRVRPHLVPTAWRFLVALVFASAVVTCFAAAVYVHTGLLRFMFHHASLLAYFPIFSVAAIAIRRLTSFEMFSRVLIVIGVTVLVLQFDTAVVTEAQRLKAVRQAGVTTSTEFIRTSIEQLEERLNGLSHRHELTDPSVAQCDLVSAGQWIDAHTKLRTLLLIPPLQVDAGFRVLSRRAAVVVGKDGGNSKYSNKIAREWLERNSTVTHAYELGTWQALREAALRYQAEVILTPRTVAVPAESMLYSNDSWIVARAEQ